MNTGNRLDAIERRLGQIPDVSPPYAPETAAAVIGKTFKKTTYPTTAKRVYALKFATLGFAESEGAAIDDESLGGEFFALNVGASVPPQGEYVVCNLVDGQWVFSYNKPTP